MKYPIPFPVSSFSRSLTSASSIMTSSDSSSNTWLTESYYLDGCGGQAIMVMYRSTSACYETDNRDFPSMTFNCGTNITSTFYTDRVCQSNPLVVTSDEQLNHCYTAETDDDGYVNQNGQWAYMQFSCTTGTPQPLQAPSVSMNLYMGQNCSETHEVIITQHLQNYCYNSAHNDTSFTSVKYVDPYDYEFEGLNCIPANVTGVEYPRIGKCMPDGATSSILLTKYNSASSSSSSSNSVSVAGQIAITAVFCFMGGLFFTALLFNIYEKKAPLSSKVDKDINLNNL